jgi:hypothetical protein
LGYAYLSTGRDTVMSEDDRLIYSIALEAVLSAARSLHIDIDELCETAIESLMVVPNGVSPAVALAINAIEKAAEVLDYDDPETE